MGRDERTGLPNQPIPCPLGARHTSDSCEKAHCAYVSIPLHHRISFSFPPVHLPTGADDDYFSTIWGKLLFLTLVVICLKYFLVLCSCCFSLLDRE